MTDENAALTALEIIEAAIVHAMREPGRSKFKEALETVKAALSSPSPAPVAVDLAEKPADTERQGALDALDRLLKDLCEAKLNGRPMDSWERIFINNYPRLHQPTARVMGFLERKT